MGGLVITHGVTERGFELLLGFVQRFLVGADHAEQHVRFTGIGLLANGFLEGTGGIVAAAGEGVGHTEVEAGTLIGGGGSEGFFEMRDGFSGFAFRH